MLLLIVVVAIAFSPATGPGAREINVSSQTAVALEPVAAEVTVPIAEVSAATPEAVTPEVAAVQPDAVASAVEPITTAPLPVDSPAGPGALWVADGIVLVGAERWSTRSLAAVDAALAALPARIRARLGNRLLGPLYININDAGRTMGGQQPYNGPANFYSTNEGRNEVVLYPEQGVMTVLHELGHAFNLRATPAASYAQVLLQPEMQSFLAAAGWQVDTPEDTLATIRNQTQVALSRTQPAIWDRLSRDDPLEDFANTFAYYFGDPQGLHRLSPARYAWFDANVGR